MIRPSDTRPAPNAQSNQHFRLPPHLWLPILGDSWVAKRGFWVSKVTIAPNIGRWADVTGNNSGSEARRRRSDVLQHMRRYIPAGNGANALLAYCNAAACPYVCVECRLVKDTITNHRCAFNGVTTFKTKNWVKMDGDKFLNSFWITHCRNYL